MPKPRRAKLFVRASSPGLTGTKVHWVRFNYANGEGAMHTEIYDSASNARRAKADIEAAMADYLRSKGYVVTKPEEAGR